jgi:rare lipoprotein A
MVARNLLRRVIYWPAFFLCILFIVSSSIPLGYQFAGTICSRYAEITGLELIDFSSDLSFIPSVDRPETVRCFTTSPSPRPALHSVSNEVKASWYGQYHHNKLTASGQRFDMHKNTLAHRTLPLGTKVRLVNLNNGKSAEGVVNDRGPYIKGRDVDVSYAIAKQLGFVKKGIINLTMEPM